MLDTMVGASSRSLQFSPEVASREFHTDLGLHVSQPEDVLWLQKWAWEMPGANSNNQRQLSCLWDCPRHVQHSLSEGPNQDWAPDAQSHSTSPSGASWVDFLIKLLSISRSAKTQYCHLSWCSSVSVASVGDWVELYWIPQYSSGREWFGKEIPEMYTFR